MTKRNHDIVDLEVDIKGRTAKAILVHDGDREAWLPKSQIEFHWDDTKHCYVVTLPEALAIEKELV